MRDRMLLVSTMLISLVSFLAATGPATANPGAVEINQARALAGGVTPSDLPGFPVTIDGPGSYFLTGNLDLGSELPDVHGIDIVTPVLTENVTIDLRGFEIAGPAICTGFADFISCSNTGLGNGINGPGASEVVIRDGKIRNMGQHGLEIWGTARVENVIVKHNAQDGVNAGFGSSVSDVTARENGDDGISAGDGSTLRDLVGIGNGGRGVAMGFGSNGRGIATRDNGGIGIDLQQASSLSDSSSSLSRGYGIYAQGNNVVRGVTVYANLDIGIRFLSGVLTDVIARENTGAGIEVHLGTVDRCDLWFNGSPALVVINNSTVRNCIVRAGTGDGISVGSPARIENNTITGDGVSSTGRGILLTSSGSRVEGNTIRGTQTGIEALTPVNYILGNSVTGATTAFNLGTGNATASIVDLSAGGMIPNGRFEPNVEY